MKPIVAATMASVTVLATARNTSDSTGRPVAIELPRSPLTAFHSHSPNCTGSGTVEAVGRAHLRGQFLRRVGGKDGDQRIARRDVDEQETDQRDAQNDRNRVDEAPCDVSKHNSPLSCGFAS